MNKFSERLKQMRKEKNISQEELAKYLGISRSAIGNYEQGKREPDFETLEALADYFNCDMDYLAGKGKMSLDISNLNEDAKKRLIIYYYKLLELQQLEKLEDDNI